MKPSTFRTSYYTDRGKKKRAFDGLQQINIKMRNRHAETTRTIQKKPMVDTSGHDDTLSLRGSSKAAHVERGSDAERCDRAVSAGFLFDVVA